MATEKEEIILDIKIDQGDLNDQLVETRKSIEQVKKAQQDLRKEYIAGTKDVDEYTKESIELERTLKREQESYKNLTKAVETNSNSLNAQRQRLIALKRERDNVDKSTKEGAKQFENLTKKIKELNDEVKKQEQAGGDFQRDVGNYGKSAEEAAKSINVAGTSVGDLTGKLASFANPATAAVAIAGGLFAAYAKSARGARDLAFAQEQLATSTQLLLDDFGDLVGAGGEERGGGLISQVTRSFTAYFAGFSNAAVSNFIAQQKEILKDLEISRALVAGFQKEDERLAENQRRIRDDEEQSLEKRLQATEQIVTFLETARDRTITVIRAQIEAIKSSTLNYDLNREAQLRVAELESEILDKQEEINGKLTENLTARRAIVQALEEQAQLEEFIRREQGAPGTDVTRSTVDVSGSPLVERERLEGDAIRGLREKLNQDLLALNNELYIKEVQRKREAEETKRQLEQDTLAVTSSVINATSQLFDEQSAAYKALALSQNFMDTYRAATAALAPPPTGAGPLFGPILAAATVISGLANAQKIAGFEEGGYTGAGRSNQPAGIVHKNEVVWNAQDVAIAGGPSVVDSMRPTYRSRRSRGFGYQDGGVVVNSQLQNANQSLAVMDMIRNMPEPIVGVKEFTTVSRRVQVKESLSKR